jgi:hypothetical protein
MYNFINIYLIFFLFLLILNLFLTKKYGLCIDCKNYKVYKEPINNNLSCKYIEFNLDDKFNEDNIISLLSLKYNEICKKENKNIKTLINDKNYKKNNFNSIKIKDIKKDKIFLINIEKKNHYNVI